MSMIAEIYCHLQITLVNRTRVQSELGQLSDWVQDDWVQEREPIQQFKDKIQQEWQGDGMCRGRRKNRLSGSLGVYTSNFVEGNSIVNLVHQLTTLPVGWPIHQIFPLANRLTCIPKGRPLCQSVDLLANGKIWRMGRNTYTTTDRSA
jgi:hypothetical protein